MNAQEIFNKVATHLLTQNERSVDVPEGSTDLRCAYRSAGGSRRCAAGCLLTDEEAKVADGLDSSSWVYVRDVVDLSRFADHHDMIGGLQVIHDCDEPEKWRSRLHDFAAENGLSRAVLDGDFG